MSYEVRCECGKAYPVGPADAGVSFPCPCGREVDVPNLHQLRASAGQLGVSPTVQLQAMLLQNELPGTTACACCHRDTGHLIRVSIVCERVITTGQASPAAVALGCLVFGWAGALLAHMSQSGKQSVQHGTDVSFVVPVRVCEACAHGVRSAAEVTAALRATPIYDALLHQYPRALVRRIG